MPRPGSLFGISGCAGGTGTENREGRWKVKMKIPEILKPYEEDLNSTIKPSDRIIFTLEETKPWESKLGGCPYLEDIRQYPMGESGKPMMFLAQLNLAEMPPLPDLPQEGLLQFYVEDEDCYGLDGKCVVRYIPEYQTDEKMLVTENPYRDGYEENLPFTDNCKISFAQEEMFIGTACPEYEEKFGDVPEKVSDALYDLCSMSDSRVGGYPYFVQCPPAYYSSSEYVLLLQLDVDDTSGLMFGDAGNCNFIISRKDLLARDFSQVEYDWQCC